MRLQLLLTAFLIGSHAIAQNFAYQRNDTVRVIKQGKTLVFPWAGGFNAPQFGTMDLNFDGISDLVLFERTDNGLYTFINEGIADSASYLYAPEYEVFFPKMTNWMRMVDYNCDGKKDLYTWTPGGIRVFKNISTTGNIAFTLVEDLVYSFQPPNNLNLYVSSVDLPGIADIDGDGDVDVLSFGVFGNTLEYHKNLSQELYGNCDSLKFELKNLCWGGFYESTTSNTVELNFQGWPCTTGNVSNPEFSVTTQYQEGKHNSGQKKDPVLLMASPKHAGSTIMIFDVDSNDVVDLVVGDVSFGNLVMLQNGGTAPNQNSLIVYEDTLYPYYDVPVAVEIFPAAFYEDVDNDGVSDLLVSTNSPNLSVDKESIWYYHNTDLEDHPIFERRSISFLQNQMIEHGTGGYPVLFDYNSDGLLDLIVANMGTYDPATTTYKPYVALYENTGTSTVPVFTWVTDDFENLSASGLPTALYPTFGDLDNDGDQDMMIGDADGHVHYYSNTAGAGNVADFALTQPLVTDQTANPIDAGQYATPQLIDLDRDGDLDLIIGNRSGKIHFYKNKGSVSAPVWEFVTDALGGVDIREWFELPNGAGFAVPAFIDRGGQYELFVGSKSGFIHHYDQIDGNLSGNFNRVDTTFDNICTGVRSAPAFGELDNDGEYELIVGNYRGGLSYFDYQIDETSVEEISLNTRIYPNPSSAFIYIETDRTVPGNAQLMIFDMAGRMVYEGVHNGMHSVLDVSGWKPGMYIGKWGHTPSGAFRFMVTQQR